MDRDTEFPMQKFALQRQLERLNAEQRAAVSYPDSQIVIAGAGSGKTTVLVSKVAYLLVYKQVPASDIMAVTFTRKAGDEMSLRLRSLVGDIENGVKTPNISNFHSASLRIIRNVSMRKREALANLGWQPNFSIVDPADTIPYLVNYCMTDAFSMLNGSDDVLTGGKGKEGRAKVRRNVKMMCELYQRAKDSSLEDHGAVINKYAGDSVAVNVLLNMYEDNNRANNTMDFADIIRVSTKFIQDFGLHKKYIFVDELQDTNANQFSFLAALYKNAEKNDVSPVMFGVGDIDQGIYEWRSAEPQNAIKFRDLFVCKENHLVINYRSTPSIVQASNEVIRQNKKRIDKSMVAHAEEGDKIGVWSTKSDKDEAKKIADYIAEVTQRNKDTCCILVRGRRQVPLLELSLREHGIVPAMRKDLSMLNNIEVKRSISLLRLFANYQDRTNTGYILSFLDGFGKKSIEDIVQSPQNIWASPSEFKLNKKQSVSLRPVTHCARDVWAAKDNASLMRCAVDALKGPLMDTIMHGLDDENKTREVKVKTLFSWMSKQRNIVTCLDELTLAPDADMPEDAQVSIMTVHGAKGLEFDHVFIAGATEKNFPSDHIEENEESRRLFYVALTRAAKKAIVSFPAFAMGEKAEITGMTSDIPKNLIEKNVVHINEDFVSNNNHSGLGY